MDGELVHLKPVFNGMGREASFLMPERYNDTYSTCMQAPNAGPAKMTASILGAVELAFGRTMLSDSLA